jgi:UDP:flavonoid glycosyltransferase YjiC (YdhE family)
VSEPLRVLVGVEGMAGHALPALALARGLARRGHAVTFASRARWRELAEAQGLRFAGEPDEAERGPAAAARALLPAIDELRPDLVVSDALSLAPALAAEVRGLSRAVLLPEVYPVSARGMPYFSLGLLPPRTPVGAAAWRALAPMLGPRLPGSAWLRESRAALDAERRELGLGPSPSAHGPVGNELTLVGTFPQLEYPREWPAQVHVVGPMVLDPPHPPVALPPGDEPLVVVAPSTVKDPEGKLLRAAAEALAGEPVRALLAKSGGRARLPAPLPENVVVADWIDYSQVIPAADLVVCHGNHGTVVRALGAGVPVLVSPAMPDDAEHGARVAWAGAGLMVPRALTGAGSLRRAVSRILGDPAIAARAGEIAAWGRAHDGPAAAASLLEHHARRIR